MCYNFSNLRLQLLKPALAYQTWIRQCKCLNFSIYPASILIRIKLRCEFSGGTSNLLSHYSRGAQTPGDVCVASPNILSIVTAVLSLHTKMCIISYASGSLHILASTVQNLLYFILLAPRIWELLLNFWKLCTPIIIIIIFISFI